MDKNIEKYMPKYKNYKSSWASIFEQEGRYVWARCPKNEIEDLKKIAKSYNCTFLYTLKNKVDKDKFLPLVEHLNDLNENNRPFKSEDLESKFYEIEFRNRVENTFKKYIRNEEGEQKIRNIKRFKKFLSKEMESRKDQKEYNDKSLTNYFLYNWSFLASTEAFGEMLKDPLIKRMMSSNS